eukprot:m.211619 g.211619  ORF g.211619 m.211619 type:complete len:69 (-) comp15495_c0_seq7:1247-1453(-)
MASVHWEQPIEEDMLPDSVLAQFQAVSAWGSDRVTHMSRPTNDSPRASLRWKEHYTPASLTSFVTNSF